MSNKMPNVAAVILVGGKARRLNGINKSNLRIGSQTCLQWTLNILTGQVEKIVLNVGQNDRYNHAEHQEIIFDWPNKNQAQGAALAILGSLSWAKRTGYDAIISVPVDTPLLPGTFVPALKSANDGNRPSVYKTAEGLQGLHAIWPISCFNKIKHAILIDGIMKISSLHTNLNSKEIQITAEESFRFTNVNDKNDIRIAEQYLV